MAIVVHDQPEQERYEVLVDAAFAGFAQYHRRGSLLALMHTELDPRFKGAGVGTALIKGALDDARAGELVVLPFCPFVRGYVERHPEYLDLVPQDRRADFDL